MFSKYSILYLVLLFSAVMVNAATFYGPSTIANKSYENLTLHGPANLKKVKVNNLTVHGPLIYEELEVYGILDVQGPLKGTEGKFQDVIVKGTVETKKTQMGSLHVSGPVNLNDFAINGETLIYGSLVATKGSFQNLRAGSRKKSKPLSLTDVTVRNITINKNLDGATLSLEGKTTVSGSIKFLWGDGIVTKEKDVTIVGGIEGGSLLDNIKTAELSRGALDKILKLLL